MYTNSSPAPPAQGSASGGPFCLAPLVTAYLQQLPDQQFQAVLAQATDMVKLAFGEEAAAIVLCSMPRWADGRQRQEQFLAALVSSAATTDSGLISQLLTNPAPELDSVRAAVAAFLGDGTPLDPACLTDALLRRTA